jgi:glycosyltransferase involved in cell wall biosynthesis
VIIPLYNRAEYIGRAIESVLNGAWKDFEIIIVDNGSSDGSVGAVEKYLNEGNIMLLKIEVNNTAGALNLGIRHARGKYICQLDSDDLYTPETLGALYSYMESNPGSALGVSYYDCIGPDDQALAEYGVVRHPEYDRNNLIRTDGLGAARIWHRCVLEELGGFDEENLGSYGEDYDLALKISEKYDILRIPYVLYRYRMNHKRAEEKTDYLMRHAKKTFARRSAIMRRRLINGASGEDGTP